MVSLDTGHRRERPASGAIRSSIAGAGQSMRGTSPRCESDACSRLRGLTFMEHGNRLRWLGTLLSLAGPQPQCAAPESTVGCVRGPGGLEIWRAQGLGAEPLRDGSAVAALAELSVGSQRLEIDLETGERGGRDEGCAALLRKITGCEAATVVNNNAAATILILATLAHGRKVIVSRGELVEIGGSFRIPEVMEQSGAILAEVGATNRTHLEDYRRALDAECGMLLKVHTSNYRIVGFTGEVEIEELAALGREAGVAVVHDLGSGCVVDLAQKGLRGESLVQRSLAAGADLVCFSGDKLLGGPQAGIIAGTKEAVDRCRKHPLMRAFRPGRLVYTALEATLRLYLDGEEEAAQRVPSLRRLFTAPSELERRARMIADQLGAIDRVTAVVVECTSQAGSGALPAREFPSWGVQVTCLGENATTLSHKLRTGEPSLLVRVQDGALLLDARTIEEDEISLVLLAIRALPSAA